GSWPTAAAALCRLASAALSGSVRPRWPTSSVRMASSFTPQLLRLIIAVLIRPHSPGSEDLVQLGGGVAGLEVDEAHVGVSLGDEHEHALAADRVQEGLAVRALDGRLPHLAEVEGRGDALAHAEGGGGHGGHAVGVAGSVRVGYRQTVGGGDEHLAEFRDSGPQSLDDVVELRLLVHCWS